MLRPEHNDIIAAGKYFAVDYNGAQGTSEPCRYYARSESQSGADPLGERHQPAGTAG